MRKFRVFVFEIGCWIWWSSYIWYMYLYWWSKCAFSILLSLARRFWNQILIWVSVRSKASASSNLLGLDMYSFLWYSSSNLQTRKNCVSGNHIIKQWNTHWEISGMFQPYPYSYWQYHLTIFAFLIPKWCKYPILGSKTNRGDIRHYFKTYEKNW